MSTASILDTLARVYFEKGDLKSALKWQREAVEQAGSSIMAGELRESLIRYQSAAGSKL